jgi:cell division protein FtsW
MILYLAFLLRCIKIVMLSPKAFGALLAVGLSVNLVIQALLNMAVTVNLLPVTGLPLPMVSWGGTSIWFTSISIGLILSVSRSIEKRELERANG